MKSFHYMAAIALAFRIVHAAPNTVDANFANTAGQVFQPNHYGGVASVLVQPDGKIIVGSNEMPGTVNGNLLQLPLIRFNSDGTVDNTFFADNDPNGSNGGIYYDGQGWSEVHAIGLLSDGKIVAAGVMQGVRTGTVASPGTFLQSNSIVRFNADGTIDTTFQTAGTTAWPTGGLNYIEDVTIQPDDKIIAVGGFGGFRNSFSSPTQTRYGIARLNLDGSVDTTFQINPADFGVPAGASQLRAQFRQAAIDSAGRILVAGYFEWGPAYPATGTVHVLARLNPDGSRDTTFAPVIPPAVTEFDNVVVEPSGNIMVIGSLGQSTTTSWMKRFFPDGSPDTSFTLDLSLGPVRGRPLQIDAAGRYLLATRNSPSTYQDKLVRVLNNGTLDSTFTAVSNYVNGVVGSGIGYFGTFTTSPNGKIYSGSYFDRVNAVNTVKIVAFEGDYVPNSPGTLQFAAAGFSASEMDGTLRIAVSRTNGITGAASATLSLNHISTSGADLGSFSTTVNFAAGIGGTQFITIPITDDAIVENSETATLNLTGVTGASTGSITSTTITILDGDSPPQILAQPQTLFVPPGSPFSLSVGATSGTLPLSYQWYLGTNPISGATTATYSVTAADVALHQGNYSVVVTNSNGSTTSATASVTVKNPAILTFSSATASAIENDGTLTLTLQRGGSDVGAVSVDVTLVNGTATSTADFIGGTTTISWANGDTANKTVSIPLTNDAIAEPAENFQAQLSNYSLDAIPGGVTAVAITLLDDDAGPAITQPLVARRAVTGWNSSLSVGVQSQTTVTYQWFKNGVLIPGANTSTLNFTPVSLTDYGIYSVEATNTAGTVVSGPVEFGARPNPLTPVALDLTISSNQFSGARSRLNGGHLIYGAFTSVSTSTGSVAAQRLLRTGADGKVDTSFLPAFNTTVNHAIELPDGSTLAAGSFTTVGVISTPGGFVRILPNGSVDADFLSNLPLTLGTIRDLKLGPDGWIYVVHSTGVDRMSAAGVVDPSFNTNVLGSFQTNGTYNAIDFAPGGSFYLAGNFNLATGPSGQTLRRLVRLNPNGTYDPTWKYTSAGALTYFGVQSDGRIIVPSSAGSLIRLMPDGASDPTFTTITGMYNSIFAVAADDSIYIVNGSSTTTKLRHFLTNGTLDTIFNNGVDPGANNTITYLSALSDGMIAINGTFSTFNGIASTNRPLLLNAELRSINISSQPLAQQVNSGNSAVFQVVASSVLPLTYQWRKNGIDLPGETNPTLTLTNATTSNNGDYSVFVSSNATSVTSTAARLIVRDAPEILSTPADRTQLVGQALTLAVDWVGITPATFAWFRNGQLVSGQDTATLSIANPTQADSGSYTLQITNALGQKTSIPMVVNIVPNPTALAPGYIVAAAGSPNVNGIVPESGGAYIVHPLSGIVHASGNYNSNLARIESNGNIRTPFTTDANSNLQGLVRDPASGSLFLFGNNLFVNGTNSLRVAKVAANGAIDATYTSNATAALTTASVSVSSAAVDADGRLLAAGNSRLVRLDLNGTLHGNFTTSVSGMSVINQVTVLPNGKILVLGNSTMRRLMPDGSIDSTFTFPTLTGTFTINQFALDSLGYIYLANDYFSTQSVIRLAPDGALMNTFAFSDSTYGNLNRILVMPDGNIIIAHNAGARLVRMKPDGTIDPSFTFSGVGFNGSVSALELADDGSIWVGGSFTTFNGANARGVVRLTGTPIDSIITTQPLSQTIDTSTPAQFTVVAAGANSAPLTYLWRKNGIPLENGGDVSGATTASVTIANSEDADEGTYDVIITNTVTGRPLISAAANLTVLRQPEFLAQLSAQNLEVGQALTLTATARGAGTLGYQWFRNDEEIIGANSATYSVPSSVEQNTGIYRVEISNAYGILSSDPVAVNVTLPAGGIRLGSPTLSFGNTVSAILPLPDGRTLVGGAFTNVIFNSTIYNIDELALLDAAGNLVTTFDLNPSGAINALQLMPDGGVLVAGAFTNIGGQARTRVARLTPALQIDTTWNVGTGPNNPVLCIELSANGYYLGGSFTSFAGDSTRANVCHIFADGSLDPFFTPPVLGTINQIHRNGTGLVVGGNFTINNPVTSTSQVGIVRLLGSGAHDTSFNSTMATSGTTVFGLVELPDGKWLAAGTAGRLRRFLANGTHDTSWLSTASHDINALAVQRDGRILAAGNFTTIAGQSVTRVARLNANGTFDSTFAQGAGADGVVNTIALDALGTMHIGGAFNNYRSVARGRYALLNGTPLSIGIAQQPTTLTVNPSSTATFTVNVLATDTISYQWRKNGTLLVNGGDVSGATSATLSIANAEDADEANYDVVVTHNGDTTSVTSASASLTVLGAPEILVSPSAVTTETGLGATFRVSARGVAPFTYQWFRGTTALTDGTGIAGSSTATLTLSNLAVADSGNIVVRITNGLGFVETTPVALLVQRLPYTRDRSVILPVNATGINDVIPFDDGSYLIAGSFTSITHTSGSATRRSLAKINANGSLNTSVPQVNGSGAIEIMATDANGKIYIGGGFTSINTGSGNVTRNRIARLNADLTLDTTFNPPGTGPNNAVKSIVPLADGKVLIGGDFANINSVAGTAYIARLNSDGTVDTGFVSQAGISVRDIALASGGNFWVSHPNSYGGQQRIVLVDTNGARVSTFTYSGSLTSDRVLPQSDGTVISISSGWPYHQRIQQTGALVAGWPNNGGLNPSAAITAGATYPNGRTIFGGNFTDFSGQTRNRLAAIEPDGSLVSDFNPGVGFNGSTTRIRLDAAGRIWMTGAFTSYRGDTIPGMVVLNGYPILPPDPYATYVASLPEAQRGETQDPDGDTVPNLVEFVFGLSPTTFNPAPAAPSTTALGATISGSLDPAKTYRIVELVTPKDTQGVTINLAATTDLTFTDGATATEFGTRTDNGTTETRRYFLTPATNDAPSLFWRIQASR